MSPPKPLIENTKPSLKQKVSKCIVHFFPLAEYCAPSSNLLLQLIYIDQNGFYIIVLLFNILRISYMNTYLCHFNLPSPFQLLYVPLTTFQIHDTVPLLLLHICIYMPCMCMHKLQHVASLNSYPRIVLYCSSIPIPKTKMYYDMR